MVKIGDVFLLTTLSMLSFASLHGQDAAQNGDIKKLGGYFSIVHTIVSFSKEETSYNFDGSYSVGFPAGINYLLSEKIAFSLEFVPSITSENGDSGVDGLLFHPGVIFRNIGGFSFLTRAAFNTNGRYGFTLVANKPIFKAKNVTYFLATPIPIRFGNEDPASLTIGFQFGVSF